MELVLRRILYLSLLAIIGINIAKADNAFYIQSTNLNVGIQQTISISLANTDEVTSFQFDIKIPDGIFVNRAINDDEIVPDISLTDRKMNKHLLSCTQLNNDTYRIIVLSMSNQSFKGNDGAIVNISVTASPSLPSGSYTIGMSNIHLVPIFNDQLGDRIDQPNYTSCVDVTNQTESSDVNVALALATTTLKAENKQTLSIALENNIEVTAFQFDIVLPNGITINDSINDDNENILNIQLTSRKSSSHNISYNKRENGKYTIVVLSMKNQALNGIDGDIVTMNINVPSTMAGSYDIVLNNIHIVPLINGSQGPRIDLPDAITTITINNDGSGETPIGNNQLTISPLTLISGETNILNIDMSNEKNICSFQFNIKLPEGINIVKEYNEENEYIESISLSSRKKSSHELTFKQTANNEYFLMAYSLSNATFRDNSGCIVSIKIKVNDDLPEGNYNVILRNAIMVTPDEEKIEPEDYNGQIKISSCNDTRKINNTLGIIKATKRGNRVIIEGVQKNDKLSVIGIDGKVHYSTICKNNTLVIPAHHLHKGINIINILHGNKQITKKVSY